MVFSTVPEKTNKKVYYVPFFTCKTDNLIKVLQSLFQGQTRKKKHPNSYHQRVWSTLIPSWCARCNLKRHSI